MVSLRHRKTDQVESKHEPEKLLHSPVTIYRKLVSKSSTIFRSDIEFVEKPRQIIFGSVLILVLCYLSGSTVAPKDDLITSFRFALWSFLAVTATYSMLQSKDGLMVRCFSIIV